MGLLIWTVFLLSLAVYLRSIQGLVSLGSGKMPDFAEIHGKCFVFNSGRKLTVPIGYESRFLTFGGKSYIKIWSCPEMGSCKPVKVQSLSLSCIVCKGYCAYKGGVYREGRSFTSVDGITRCNCLAGGILSCPEEQMIQPTNSSVDKFCEI